MKINTIKMICNKNRIISIIITLFTFLTLIFCCSHICEAAGTELVWDESPEAYVTGYYIHCGIEPEIYTNSYQVDGKINTSYLIEDLLEKLTEDLKYTPDWIHIAVTAYTDTGEESIYSNEVIYSDYSLITQSQLTIVSVDSEELVAEDGAAENAIDGQHDTFWVTEWYQSEPTTCPHKIVIDLGDIYLVGGFQYLPRQDGNINGTVADYSIYVSEDGITWGEAVTTGTFAGDITEKKVTFAGKNGRYVRFVAMSEVNGNPWTSAAEINILGTFLSDDSDDGIIDIYGMDQDYSLVPQSQLSIVSVDSEELVAEDGAAENTIDGLPDTFWVTEWYQSEPTTCPHKIVIDLGDIYLVGGFQYLPRQDGNINGTVADYSIYVSEDGITWGEAVTTGTFAGDITEKKVTFAGKNGRYVRFVAMSEVNGNPWTSAAEINILGGILQY